MGRHEPIREGPHPHGSQPRQHPPAHTPPTRTPLNTDIPDKLYFRIGDVAEICDVPAYVLRFWETEFTQLKPNKGGTGQRLYRRRDVEMALRIKRLLYDEGYTIPGARQLLKSEHKQPAPQLSLLPPATPDPRKLQTIRRELESILAILSQPPVVRPMSHSRSQRRRDLPTGRPAPGPASLTGKIPFDLLSADDPISADLPSNDSTSNVPPLNDPPTGE